MFNNFFFFENRAVFEIMWKIIVEPDRSEMTIWRVHIACLIHKATHKHSEYRLFQILNMFRTASCSSSGGQIVLLQSLVSSLSIKSRTVFRLTALNRHTVRRFTESDDTRGCNNKISPPEDEQGTARNMMRIIM